MGHKNKSEKKKDKKFHSKDRSKSKKKKSKEKSIEILSEERIKTPTEELIIDNDNGEALTKRLTASIAKAKERKIKMQENVIHISSPTKSSADSSLIYVSMDDIPLPFIPTKKADTVDLTSIKLPDPPFEEKNPSPPPAETSLDLFLPPPPPPPIISRESSETNLTSCLTLHDYMQENSSNTQTLDLFPNSTQQPDETTITNNTDIPSSINSGQLFNTNFTSDDMQIDSPPTNSETNNLEASSSISQASPPITTQPSPSDILQKSNPSSSEEAHKSVIKKPMMKLSLKISETSAALISSGVRQQTKEEPPSENKEEISTFEKKNKVKKSRWAVEEEEEEEVSRSSNKKDSSSRKKSSKKSSSRSRSRSKKKSRSRSGKRSKKSRSRSKKKSRSRSKKRSKRSRSRSRKKSKKSRRSSSRSRKRSRRSRSRSRRSRSRSRRSRSRSRRSRSRSKRARSRSRRSKSRSRSRRSRSKSKRARSRSRRSRSRSRRSRSRSKRARSRSRRSRSRSRSRQSRKWRRDKRSPSESRKELDNNLNIDKARLRQIALKNAFKMGLSTSSSSSSFYPNKPPVVNGDDDAKDGQTIKELTDFCKKIADVKDDDLDKIVEGNVVVVDEEEMPFIPARTNKEMRLQALAASKPQTLQEQLIEMANISSQFPVSRGNDRTNKTDNKEGEAYPEDNMGTYKPLDKDALKMSNWVAPGQFIPTMPAKVSSLQLESGPTPDKDMFTKAPKVAGGIGKLMLMKLGWKEGEGLGKNKHGMTDPIPVNIKTDRKGFVWSEEDPDQLRMKALEKAMRQQALIRQMAFMRQAQMMQQQRAMMMMNGGRPPLLPSGMPVLRMPNQASARQPLLPMPSGPRARFPSDANNVMQLTQTCSTNDWPPPQFLLLEETHPVTKVKAFKFKIILNGEEFVSPQSSSQKKQAKNDAALLCLQKLGLAS